jgi:hypothetical protein
MISLIGSALGFATSAIPRVLGFFEAKRDQSHELNVLDRQLQNQLQAGDQKMQLMDVEAGIQETAVLHKEHASITRKSAQWCINLSATVRPVITYLLFLEFMILTGLLAAGWITGDMFSLLWSSDGMAPVWAACVSFWFGQRTFNRK